MHRGNRHVYPDRPSGPRRRHAGGDRNADSNGHRNPHRDADANGDRNADSNGHANPHRNADAYSHPHAAATNPYPNP